MKRTAKEFFNQYHTERWNLKGTYEERGKAEMKMFEDWFNEMEVGDHCHIQHWSDVSPCTIIKRTKSTITVRFDKAERDPNWKPEFIVGGFSLHCTNNDEQKWIISEDPDGHTEVFRWKKSLNAFANKANEKLYPEWEMHYDYNF